MDLQIIVYSLYLVVRLSISHEKIALRQHDSIEWEERLETIAIQSRTLTGVKLVELSDRVVMERRRNSA